MSQSRARIIGGTITMCAGLAGMIATDPTADQYQKWSEWQKADFDSPADYMAGHPQASSTAIAMISAAPA